MSFSCPRCGFQQPRGRDCARCGVVFDRYDPQATRRPRSARNATPERTVLETLARFYRVFRWVALAATTVVLLMILRPDAPPVVEEDERAHQRLQTKIARAHRAAASGAATELRLDEAELNSWMGSNLALPPSPSRQPEPMDTGQSPGVEEVQSNVRDVKVALEGDRIRGYVLFELYGKDLSITLDGHLSVREGYLRLEPTAMKVGSLPIPRATVERAVRRLFESPENREQFRVPPHVRDIRVVDGTLIVSY